MVIERMREPATPEDAADAEPKPEGPSIKEIRADRQKSGFFANMLEQEGQEDLAKKLFFEKDETGKDTAMLTGEDFQRLEEYRVQFAEKLDRSERVKTMITPELITEMGALHTDLGYILKAAGSRDISRLVGNYLQTLIFTDSTAFQTIYEGVEKLEQKIAARKAKDEEIKTKLTQYGIGEEEYLDTLRRGATQELREMLKENEGRRGIIDKLRDWQGTQRDARLLAAAEGLASSATRQEINRLLDDVQFETEGLASILTATLTNNPDLNRAISKIMRGETPPKMEANVMGFAEAKQLLLTEEQIQERWEQEKLKPEYKKYTDDKKRTHLEEFKQSLVAPADRKIGSFFAKFSKKFLDSVIAGMNFTLK